jgi:kynureninase
MKYIDSLAFAKQMDQKDSIRSFKNKFFIPRKANRPSIYMAGNSLGLQPKLTRSLLIEELEDWATLGVEGHVGSRRPWIDYHRLTRKGLARLTGAKQNEVVAMGQLTTNLHLMLVSFYRPTKQRFKILIESGAFPSDVYAVVSQVRFHGFDPDVALVHISPKEGNLTLSTSDIIECIRDNDGAIAMVLLGAVQYYTGQFFNLREIAKAGQEAGAVVGFDLAHAIGNVPLSLHRDNIDFAVWCSYKYLNSGPGGLAGIFVHQKHHDNSDIPRFNGWWGSRASDRFQMLPDFVPAAGVDAWQVSNVPIFQAAAHLASLQLFGQTSMAVLRQKSIQLTGFLEFLLRRLDPAEEWFKIITPKNQSERGCQLSLLFTVNGRKVFNHLSVNGVIADWREPDVIRLAPVPLYNSFEDVFRLTQILKQCLGGRRRNS